MCASQVDVSACDSGLGMFSGVHYVPIGLKRSAGSRLGKCVVSPPSF